MVNVVVTVEALASELHSGMFGGAAPDALAALIAMLASLRDEQGNTTIDGLDNTQTWTGAPYPPEQFRTDAGVLDGVALLGDGTVSDMLWARPAVTVLGIDCPPVIGSTAAIVPRAAARLNLRVPPGMAARGRRRRSSTHLSRRAVGRPRRGGARGDRVAVPGGSRRPGVRGDGRGDAGGLRAGDDHAGAGRIDPAVQRASPTPTRTRRSS